MAISSFSILPTGMPVQPEITSPTICASTRDADQRRSRPAASRVRAFSSASSRRAVSGVRRARWLPRLLPRLPQRRAAAAAAAAGRCTGPTRLRSGCAARGSRLTRSFSFSQRSFRALPGCASVCGLLFGELRQALAVIGADGGFAVRARAPARRCRRACAWHLRSPAEWCSGPAPGGRRPYRER